MQKDLQDIEKRLKELQDLIKNSSKTAKIEDDLYYEILQKIGIKLENNQSNLENDFEDVKSKVNFLIEILKNDFQPKKLDEIATAIVAVANYQKSNNDNSNNYLEKVDKIERKITEFDSEKLEKAHGILSNLSNAFETFKIELNKKNDDTSREIKANIVEIEDKISVAQNLLLKNSNDNNIQINEMLISNLQEINKKLIGLDLKTDFGAIEKIGANIDGLIKDNASLIQNMDFLKKELSDFAKTISLDSSKEIIEYLKANSDSKKLEEISSALLAIANFQKVDKQPVSQVIALINELIIQLTNIDDEKISAIKDTINEVSQAFSDFKKEYADKNDEKSKLIKDVFIELEDKIAVARDLLVQNSQKNLENIDKILSKKAQEIEEKLISLETKVNLDALDKINDTVLSMSKENSQLTQKIEKFKDEFVDLTLNSNMAISQEMINVKQNLSELQTMLNDKSDVIEDKTTKLDMGVQKYTQDVSSKLNSFSENILMQVVTLFENISFSEDTEEIKDFISQNSVSLQENMNEVKDFVSDSALNTKDEIEEIKRLLMILPRDREENIKKLSAQIDNFSENISKNLNYELKNNIIMPLKGILTSLIDFKVKINNILDKKTLESELKSFNETILIQMAQLFENVSFEEEAQEVKAFVKNELSSLEDKLKTGFNEVQTFVQEKVRDNLKEEIDEIQKLLKEQYDTSNYSYTLYDVESDISKLRLLLNDINKNLSQEKENINDAVYNIAELPVQFETLNEDISSISKRTNKLILTSEDSNNTLKENIKDFRKILEQHNISKFAKNFEIIDKKLNMTIQSDKVLNEAFMYLAQWVDEISEKLNKIEEKAFSPQVTPIDDKLVKRVEKLEEKIDKLLENQSKDNDVKRLLELVVSQMQAGNELLVDNRQLIQKMELIEHQVSKFDANISKIVSYVDGE